MQKGWVNFKSCTYIVGITYMLAALAHQNMLVIQELLYYHRVLYAFITLELTIMLFPIWALAVGQIIREWRFDYAKYATNSSIL